jgi:conserved oligomeric Golgi complex subunit 2
MKRTEESLRRLKKGKKGAFSSLGRDDDSRDEDRIQTQMNLDTEAFGKDAKAMGIDLDRSKAFINLRETVTSLEGMNLIHWED